MERYDTGDIIYNVIRNTAYHVNSNNIYEPNLDLQILNGNELGREDPVQESIIIIHGHNLTDFVKLEKYTPQHMLQARLKHNGI